MLYIHAMSYDHKTNAKLSFFLAVIMVNTRHFFNKFIFNIIPIASKITDKFVSCWLGPLAMNWWIQYIHLSPLSNLQILP